MLNYNIFRWPKIRLNQFFHYFLNKLLLKKIQEFFEGKGKLYFYDSLTRKRQVCEFKIYKKSDLPNIIQHFKSYPLEGPKFKNFIIWSEIVNLAAKKDYFLEENFSKIKILITKLRNFK